MSRFWTVILFLLAGGAGVFLFVVEPRWKSTRVADASRGMVLTLDPGRVRAIRITNGGESFELVRKEDGWHVGPRPKDAAAPEGVGALLEAAVGLQALDVLTAGNYGSGRDLGDFGLERPRSRIDFIGDGDAALLFGKDAAAEGTIYVRRADSSDVFVVADDLQDLALRTADDFRDRRLTRFSPDQVERFAIRRGDWELALERVGEDWQITRPFRAPADRQAVERLLATMLALPIQEFVADGVDDLSARGLGDARAELVFHVEGVTAPLALRIGGEAEGGQSVLAQFTGRDSVYRLPLQAWKQLQVGPDALRDRRLVGLNLDTVDALRFRDGEASWTLARTDENWAAADRKVTAAEVEAFVRALTEARVVEYLPLTEENLRAAGLDHPRAEVAFDAWLSENTPETTAGRRPVATIRVGGTKDGRTFVRVDDAPEICVVPAEAIANFPGRP